MSVRDRPVTSGSRTRRRAASLRGHLFLILAVSFLPLLLFALGTVFYHAEERRDVFRRGATDRTLALLTAVDTELKSSVAALEVLATAEQLDDGDLAAFQEVAERVVRVHTEWLNVHLAPPSGRQVMNLLRPPGVAFHSVIDEATFREVVRSRRPVVGNLFTEPLTGRRVFPVRVPVVREGGLRYVLTALVKPEAIDGLISAQGLPPDWVGAVLDSSRTIVARTVDAGLVGEPASESLRTALEGGTQGWFQGTTIEGWPVYTPFNQSDFSGWTVAIGIPRATIDASMRHSLAIVAGLLLALLGLGFALAWVLSQRSARSLEDLARGARALGEGESPPPTPGSPRAWAIAEIEELRGAFQKATELIRSRSDERDRAEEELRLADQRKDQFLAMLGHELRNPLGVVATASELLDDPDQDPAQLRELLQRQVRHMARLLDDLLDVSRIANGSIQLDPKPCDLCRIVRQTVDDYRSQLERDGLRLELSLPEQPLWVRGDDVRLSQALVNVIQNAIKYTDPGGTVSVGLVRDDAGRARLTVRDTGVGMEPDVLAHAFESFTQADRTLDRSRGGLGLGLALVKGLIDLHGGEVRASSEGPGRGSEVEIRLPCQPAGTQPETSEGREPEREASPKRVLMIEDNESYATSLKLYLERLGHEVSLAVSGSEGIEAAKRLRPQVVFCDIGLPGIDGYQVARALRRMDGLEGVRLVAVSGYGQDSDRRRALQAGFDEHLTKPVDLGTLRRALLDGSP